MCGEYWGGGGFQEEEGEGGKKFAVQMRYEWAGEGGAENDWK